MSVSRSPLVVGNLDHKWDAPSDEIPQVPLELTSLSDSELMNLFSEFVAWQNYFDQQSVELEIHEAQAASAKQIAEARAMSMSTEKLVARQKADTLSDPDVQKRETDWLMARASRKAVAIQKDALERTANLISRELSRRISRVPTERRQSRWNP